MLARQGVSDGFGFLYAHVYVTARSCAVWEHLRQKGRFQSILMGNCD